MPCVAPAATRQVPLPQWALHISPTVNHDFNARRLRLIASSPLNPPTVMEYDFESRQLEQLASEPVPDHIQQLLGSCTLVYDEQGAASHDGARVPVTLVLPPGQAAGAAERQLRAWRDARVPQDAMQPLHRLLQPALGSSGVGSEDVHAHPAACAPAPAPGPGCGDGADCAGPVLLQAYGAYGTPLELAYDPSLLPLLARGWTLAKAHVRGGSVVAGSATLR